MSRFYKSDGTLITEVPKKTCGMRNATIADARKNGWKSSVTTITHDCINNDGIIQWKLDILHKVEKENQGASDKIIWAKYEHEVTKARELGTKTHNEISLHLRGKESKLKKHIKKWLDENILEVHEVEKTYVGEKTAGTIDVIAGFKDYGLGIGDWKTQGFDGVKKKLVWYQEHKLQLVAYKQLIDFNSTEFKKHTLIDIYISTLNELIVPKVLKQDTIDWARDTWNAMVKYYCVRKKL
jgi:hypothetical protein